MTKYCKNQLYFDLQGGIRSHPERKERRMRGYESGKATLIVILKTLELKFHRSTGVAHAVGDPGDRRH